MDEARLVKAIEKVNRSIFILIAVGLMVCVLMALTIVHRPQKPESVTSISEGGNATVYNAAAPAWDKSIPHTTRDVAGALDRTTDTIRRWVPLYREEGVDITQDEKTGRYTFQPGFTPYIPNNP